MIESLSEPALEPLSLWKHRIAPMSQITMASIAFRVAEKHGLDVEELKFGGRSRRVSHPRHEAMHEMVETGKWSLPRIGMFFGGMDHTTVIHGHRAHKRREQDNWSQCLEHVEGGILA